VRGLVLGAGEKRYDIGNFESYFKAFIDFALADEHVGYTVRQYINQLANGGQL
jgi:UTP--glucose-1-phosphate uridylyltransferase